MIHQEKIREQPVTQKPVEKRPTAPSKKRGLRPNKVNIGVLIGLPIAIGFGIWAAGSEIGPWAKNTNTQPPTGQDGQPNPTLFPGETPGVRATLRSNNSPSATKTPEPARSGKIIIANRNSTANWVAGNCLKDGYIDSQHRPFTNFIIANHGTRFAEGERINCKVWEQKFRNHK